MSAIRYWIILARVIYGNSIYRFLSADPIINKEENLANPQLWNLYSYARNNPISYFDPTGQWTISVVNGVAYGVAESGDTVSGLASQLAGNPLSSLSFTSQPATSDAVVDLTPFLDSRIVTSLQAQAAADAVGNFSPFGMTLDSAKHNSNAPNCWETASEIIGSSYAHPGIGMDPNEANQVLKSLNSSGKMYGSLVRYGLGPNPSQLKHFGIYLLTSQSGEDYIFSQEGWGGPYKISTNSELMGYGTNVSYMRP